MFINDIGYRLDSKHPAAPWELVEIPRGAVPVRKFHLTYGEADTQFPEIRDGT